jgi:hypothetical protein
MMSRLLILSMWCGMFALTLQDPLPLRLQDSLRPLTRPSPCSKWLEGRAYVDETLQLAFESALTQMPSPWGVAADLHEGRDQRLYGRLLRLTRGDAKATVVIAYAQTPEAASGKLQCDMDLLQIPAYWPRTRLGMKHI